MKRRTKRANARAHKKASKEMGMKNPGGESKYAKKKKWLARNGGFGFNYPDKPWRSS